MIGSFSEEVTNRERETWHHERQMFELEADHLKEMKRMEIELAKLEAKWSSWLVLPKTIIKLPVHMVMAIAYCIAVAREQEPSRSFWDFMK